MKTKMFCLYGVCFALSLFLTLSAASLTLAADIQLQGNVSVSGSVTASSFSGSGAGLTNIPGSQISNTSITVNQIANSAVTADKLSSNAVTANKLASNAVTPSKISFYNRVAIVAREGGDYNNPQVAMSDHESWCRERTAENPCLLKIMPGVYTVTAPLQMQPYIDIEGSGENSVIIQGGMNTAYAGIVNGADYTEIRFLTVKHTGAEAALGFYNNGASPKMTHITVSVTASGNGCTGISNYGASPVMSDVTVNASGGSFVTGVQNDNGSEPLMKGMQITTSNGANWSAAIINYESNPIISNVKADGGNYGIISGISGTVRVRNSIIKGSSSSIYSYNTAKTLVSYSQVEGGVAYSSGDGVNTCLGAYTGNYVALNTSCN